MIGEFAEALGTQLVAVIPRSAVIQACELEGRTVLQHSPQSMEADVFRGLAQQVLDNTSRVIPTPIEEIEALEALYRRHLGQEAPHKLPSAGPASPA